MPQMDFFPQRPEVHPMIYAYRDLNPDYDGLLKVGYTEKDVDRRVAQQYPTKRPDGKLPYEILYRSSAMREDGSCFTDHDVHRMLRRRKITGVGGEWFRCTVDELEAAVLAVKTDTLNEENRTCTFAMCCPTPSGFCPMWRAATPCTICCSRSRTAFTTITASMSAPGPRRALAWMRWSRCRNPWVIR